MVDKFGTVKLVNLQQPLRQLSQPIPFNAPEVPQTPAIGLLPIEEHEPAMQRLVLAARLVMEERPIFTRRALFNSLPPNDLAIVGQNMIKYLPQYVGYTLASGPWRDAIVKFGIDPRTDPRYRMYQTMMFIFDTKTQGNQEKPTEEQPRQIRTKQELELKSHLFDGESVSKDGKVWQICDITDPFLMDLIEKSGLRDRCHVSHHPVRVSQYKTHHDLDGK